MGTRPGPRGRTAAAALLCTGLLLSGCGGDAESSGQSPGESSAAPDPGASTTSPTPSPAAAPPPDAVAATGPELRQERVSVRAPQGWKVTKSDANPYALSARDPETLSSFMLSDFPAVGERTIDGEAAEALKFHGPGVERVADLTWGGLPAYRVQGRSGATRLIEVGTLHDGGDIIVQFNLSPLQEPAEQRRVVESVLASVAWR